MLCANAIHVLLDNKENTPYSFRSHQWTIKRPMVQGLRLTLILNEPITGVVLGLEEGFRV